MPDIFIINAKGGCGKTTIATNLACHFANQQIPTVLVDRDPQKSAADWFASRPKNCTVFDLITRPVNEPFQADIDGAVVIHDMPAGWIPEAQSPVLAPGCQLIIPLLPSPVDIKASLRFLMQIYRSGILEQNLRAGMLANRTRAHLRFHQELLTFLQRVQIPLIGTLRDSQNYIRAMENGISIFDLPARSVQKDLQQWQDILAWLSAGNSANKEPSKR